MKDAVQIPVASKDPEDKKKDQKADGAPKDDSKTPNDDELVRTALLHKRSLE